MMNLINLVWGLLLVDLSIGYSKDEQQATGNAKSRARVQFSHFKTEPHFEPANFTINHRTDDPSLLSPGYFFLSTQVFKPEPRSWGPQIFDIDGNLVFFNPPNSSMGPQGPHVCDFMGQRGTHLCVSNILGVTQGIWETTKAIFKNDYTLEQEPYGAVGDFAAPDGHEFAMVDDGESYLQPIFKKTYLDLTPFGGGENGTILDACFQEVAVKTGREIFHWCYMNHFPISSTYVYLDVPGNTVNITSHMAGFGNDTRAWDAFHPNAMDKNFEGDYLLSVRHTNEILKIAGLDNQQGFEPGHVIWKLGGKNSDIELDGFTLSRQHHTRFINTSPSVTDLSFFDNAYEGDNDPSSPYSSGKIVRVQHASMRATLVREYKHPDELLSMAAGSLQAMQNGNQVIGWGWEPYVTEFSEDGVVLFDANFTQENGGFSYRTRKYPWIGVPHWSPKILAYSQRCSLKERPLIVYASWNGATEVRSWRFYVSVTDKIGPWIPAGKFPKAGFETEVRLLDNKIGKRSPFVRWVSAQALDAKGRVLRETMVKTFVPNLDETGRTCNKRGCTYGHEYLEEESVADQCSASPVAYLIPGLFAMWLVFFAIEAFELFKNRAMDRWSGPNHVEYYAMIEKDRV